MAALSWGRRTAIYVRLGPQRIMVLLPEDVAQPFQPPARLTTRGQRLIHSNSNKLYRRIWLHLADAVHVRGDDRTDHEIPPARHGVAMQHDWLGAARHLARAVRVATVDDLGRIG